MRLAFDDLDVEARSVREGDGLEGDEPPARVLAILGNGVTNAPEHSQLVHDIGRCSSGGAHSGRGDMEKELGVRFRFEWF